MGRMLTRLETMVNQWECMLLPTGLTRLRSLSLNCGAGDAEWAATLLDSIPAMPACLTTLRLALWRTHTRADLSVLTQLKVMPWPSVPTQ
jgi:hypothetical protein